MTCVTDQDGNLVGGWREFQAKLRSICDQAQAGGLEQGTDEFESVRRDLEYDTARFVRHLFFKKTPLPMRTTSVDQDEWARRVCRVSDIRAEASKNLRSKVPLFLDMFCLDSLPDEWESKCYLFLEILADQDPEMLGLEELLLSMESEMLPRASMVMFVFGAFLSHFQLLLKREVLQSTFGRILKAIHRFSSAAPQCGFYITSRVPLFFEILPLSTEAFPMLEDACMQSNILMYLHYVSARNIRDMKRITSCLTTLVLAQGGNMTEKQLTALQHILLNLVGPTSTLRVLYYCVVTGRATPTSAEVERELGIKWFNFKREENEERDLHGVEAEDVLECVPWIIGEVLRSLVPLLIALVRKGSSSISLSLRIIVEHMLHLEDPCMLMQPKALASAALGTDLGEMDDLFEMDLSLAVPLKEIRKFMKANDHMKMLNSMTNFNPLEALKGLGGEMRCHCCGLVDYHSKYRSKGQPELPSGGLESKDLLSLLFAICPSSDDGSDLTRCSTCKVARYCSKKCQKAHWHAHKRNCKALAKLRSSRCE